MFKQHKMSKHLAFVLTLVLVLGIGFLVRMDVKAAVTQVDVYVRSDGVDVTAYSYPFDGTEGTLENPVKYIRNALRMIGKECISGGAYWEASPDDYNFTVHILDDVLDSDPATSGTYMLFNLSSSTSVSNCVCKNSAGDFFRVNFVGESYNASTQTFTPAVQEISLVTDATITSRRYLTNDLSFKNLTLKPVAKTGVTTKVEFKNLYLNGRNLVVDTGCTFYSNTAATEEKLYLYAQYSTTALVSSGSMILKSGKFDTVYLAGGGTTPGKNGPFQMDCTVDGATIGTLNSTVSTGTMYADALVNMTVKSGTITSLNAVGNGELGGGTINCRVEGGTITNLRAFNNMVQSNMTSGELNITIAGGTITNSALATGTTPTGVHGTASEKPVVNFTIEGGTITNSDGGFIGNCKVSDCIINGTIFGEVRNIEDEIIKEGATLPSSYYTTTSNGVIGSGSIVNVTLEGIKSTGNIIYFVGNGTLESGAVVNAYMKGGNVSSFRAGSSSTRFDAGSKVNIFMQGGSTTSLILSSMTSNSSARIAGDFSLLMTGGNVTSFIIDYAASSDSPKTCTANFSKMISGGTVAKLAAISTGPATTHTGTTCTTRICGTAVVTDCYGILGVNSASTSTVSMVICESAQITNYYNVGSSSATSPSFTFSAFFYGTPTIDTYYYGYGTSTISETISTQVYGGTFSAFYAGTTNGSMTGNAAFNISGGSISQLYLGSLTADSSISGVCTFNIYGGKIGFDTSVPAPVGATRIVNLDTTRSDISITNGLQCTDGSFQVKVFPGQSALFIGSGTVAADGLYNSSGAEDTSLAMKVSDLNGFAIGSTYFTLPSAYTAANVIPLSNLSGDLAFVAGATSSWQGSAESVPLLGNTLVLEDAISVKYYVPKVQVDAYIATHGVWAYSVSLNGFLLEGGIYRSVPEVEAGLVVRTVGETQYYTFVATGIPAKDFDKDIIAVYSGGATGVDSVNVIANSVIIAPSGTYSAKIVKLCKTIVNYGIAAHNRFYPDSLSALTPYSGVAHTGSYTSAATNSNVGTAFTFYGTSLSLEDAVCMNFYAKKADSVNLLDISFYLNGVLVDSADMTVTEVFMDEYNVCVSFRINAKDMANEYTIRADYQGTTRATITNSITYICDTYIQRQTQSANVANALLDYIEAAIDYFD